jgi:hypothetical protein
VHIALVVAMLWMVPAVPEAFVQGTSNYVVTPNINAEFYSYQVRYLH